MTHLLDVYNYLPVSFVRGEGAYVFDTTGRRYLDFAAGVAVLAFGHCHPHLVNALTEQAQKLWLVSGVFPSAQKERVAARLCGLSFAQKVFFQNSGVEAWELGAKIIRRYFKHLGQPQKWRIITLQGAFHGRSMAAIAAAKTEKLTHGFEPLTEGFDQVAFGNLNELKAAIGPETAAIHLEPVQGEGGGIRIAPADYLFAIRDWCREKDLLLYFDEIQCGMGRTGKMFAYEHTGVVPDLMCLAKGIGGGFPVGACLVSEKVGAAMTPGSHGSTYGGNALAMAVVDAALDLMTAPGFIAQIANTGARLKEKLAALAARYPQIFVEARGIGLMLGLKLQPAYPCAEGVKELLAEGMLSVAAGDNVIRLLPPLIITDREADEAVQIIDQWAAKKMKDQKIQHPAVGQP